ncbi:MAG: DUF3108 domain-containing protein [Planctomycetes bacterium]|nr:DUF3108 domain-containing protein [Planctomycetota bacterium]
MKFRRTTLALVSAFALNACFSWGGSGPRAEHDPVALESWTDGGESIAATSTETPGEVPSPEPERTMGAKPAPASGSISDATQLGTEATGIALAAAPVADVREAPQDQASAAPDPSKATSEASDSNDLFRVSGHGMPVILIPRDEKLVYDVTLDLGIITPDVGKVTIMSKVESLRANPLLLDPKGAKPAGEQAVISARAEGQYAVYELDELITTAHLPQVFPSLLHRSTQSGTENRQREMSLGYKDGKFVSVYRRDAHCKGCKLKSHFVEPTWAWQDAHHCDGCKRVEHRVWRDPVARDAPSGCVDMLSAVYVARTMILEGRDAADFQLMDRDELWDVRLRRGKSTKRIEVPAGEFDAYEITLETGVPKTETGRDASDFSGLFGIHGELSIWVEATTGVPIWIRGLVPIGPIELDVGVELAGFRGTPREFKPRE